VEKPLIALSIGDLIVDESQLERRLLDEFERAINWDAILLLDEADVVLEARSFEDVRRNGIVSGPFILSHYSTQALTTLVFLRQLEYYQGVLFLTTNRISTMDVAFQSRIQVALEFEDLKPKGRSKIWKGLLESRRKTIDADAFELIEKKVDSLASANLNGRQIRNVLNIAEGYAFNEFGKPGMMKLSHIQNAVKAALEFQKFFDKAREKSRSNNSVWAPYNGESDSD
jgi:AAA+ superfamily predicted ATPase